MTSDSQGENILYVIASLRGGAAEHVVYLMKHFCSQGHRIFLAGPKDCQATEEKLKEVKFQWIQLPLNRSYDFGSKRKLADAILKHSIDMVHCHGLRGAFYARSALRKAKRQGSRAKLLYTIHGYHPPFYRNPFLRLLAYFEEKRFFGKTTDFIIFVSESDRKLYLKHLKLKETEIKDCSEIVPNGVEAISPDKIPSKEEARDYYGLSSDHFVMGTLSRLNYQKAVHLIILVASLLKDRIPHLKILIAGDGPLLNKLESLVNRLEVTPQIHFLGYEKDTEKLYRASDCIVLSSLWEGHPLVVLEAALRGVPLVASDTTGVQGLLESGENALLFECGNAEALALAIEKLYNDPGLAQSLAENAQAEISGKFSLEAMLGNTNRIYESLLNNK